MSAILDMLYREYCRARLAEMRQQLLLLVANDAISATVSDATDRAYPDNWGRGSGDHNTVKKVRPSSRRVL